MPSPEFMIYRSKTSKIPLEKQDEFLSRLERLFQLCGFVEFSTIELFDQKIFLISPARLRSQGISSTFNIFEDAYHPEAGFTTKFGYEHSSEVGYKQFFCGTLMVYTLTALYYDDYAAVSFGGTILDVSDCVACINALFDEKYNTFLPHDINALRNLILQEHPADMAEYFLEQIDFQKLEYTQRKLQEISHITQIAPTIPELMGVSHDDYAYFYGGEYDLNFSEEMRCLMQNFHNSFEKIKKSNSASTLQKPIRFIITLIYNIRRDFPFIFPYKSFFEETMDHISDTRYLSLWLLLEKIFHENEDSSALKHFHRIVANPLLREEVFGF